MANERTYLAWVRTGIAIIALGFVVAKFGIIIKELVPNAPKTSYHLSTGVGVILVISGGFLQLMAMRSFITNKRNIESGTFRPRSANELIAGILILCIAALLVIYMLLTL
ncbi:YidH family protein [Cuniculiplasma sp. SKW3]|uniref:YidH family protein n=1 Tax=Cuniculiplasma sp. SKW3 TaxID=3400170 RepID=UPI003FD4016C